MKHYQALNEQVSVSDQVDLTDLPKLQKKGIKFMICNRPDHEDEGQETFEMIKQECQQLGMLVAFLPFSSYQIQDDDRDKLVELLKLNHRTHLYCRSGARSKRLWRAANALGRGGHDWQATC